MKDKLSVALLYFEVLIIESLSDKCCWRMSKQAVRYDCYETRRYVTIIERNKFLMFKHLTQWFYIYVKEFTFQFPKLGNLT